MTLSIRFFQAGPRSADPRFDGVRDALFDATIQERRRSGQARRRRRLQAEVCRVGHFEESPSVDSDDKDSKPFFAGGRRPGTWSKEAQEVEKSLGVY